MGLTLKLLTMTKFNAMICIFLFVSAGYGQEKPDRIQLGLFSSHPYDFEYVNGNVKEIHYRAFHITDDNGKVVKGDPFTLAEAENVELRQPWSYYYNDPGQLVLKVLRIDEQYPVVGVIDYENNRIDKIYWLRNDTLFRYDDYIYLDNGDMETQWIQVEDNHPAGKALYDLDENGNVLKAAFMDQKGKTLFVAEYTRDDDGKIKSHRGFDGEGKLKYNYVDYQYNEKGLYRTSHMNILNYEKVDQPQGEIEYEYDEHGNWIRWISPRWMMIERTIVYDD